MRFALAAVGPLLMLLRAQEPKPSAPINVYDGFESANLSDLWVTTRFITGAVEIESGVVRAGHGAARITLHAHDRFEAGIHGHSDTERDELMEAGKLMSKENNAYEFSFSMFLPADFPIVPTHLVIAQWKQFCLNSRCLDESPVLAVRFMSGVLRITQDIGTNHPVLYREAGEFRNRWLDFKFRIRFSTNRNGRIQTWLGDRQIVNYTGVTANAENAATGYPSPSRFYFKMGLYRNVMAGPMTIYIDEYRKRQLGAGEL